ncbi:MAG: TetR/AcrR family transcriptional regulator [Hyphomicrobiales bacterium]|nr:TetR/AcrR family transcriptional regulator [Hyphomicrobiales bacterium]
MPRRQAATEAKRERILDAARQIFEADGLETASLRGIAAAAGYTPAALYFHFDSKEALYAEVLSASVARLAEAIGAAASKPKEPGAKLSAAALAFFDFYAENPRDLDLGFYLFRGGMRPKGVGRERDKALNAALQAALSPIGEAARALGCDETAANLTVADLFAHATGLLLLAHTGRIRMFGASARELMVEAIARRAALLAKGDAR